jgi:hypothetical protein
VRAQVRRRLIGLAAVLLAAVGLALLFLALSAGPLARADAPAFDDLRYFGTGQDRTWDVTPGDVDNDGDLDLVVGNSDRNAVYLNDGDGTFDTTSYVFGSDAEATYSVALGDVDGDGDLDAVAGNGGQNVVYLNAGDGTFPLSHTLGADLADTRSVALGDVDGDGTLDVIAGNDGQQNVIYINDGDGTFDAMAYAFGSSSGKTYSVALGDVDGHDGLDIVVGNSGQNVVYLNGGGGTFPVSHTLGVDTGWTWSVALGDVDGDGDLDAVVGNDGQTNAVYVNAGDGTFPISRTVDAGLADTRGVTLGDIDGDGSLDVIAGNYGQQNALYLNAGDGTFPISCTFGTGVDRTRAVALSDVDDDGALDLVTGNYGQSVVYLNGGDGALGDAALEFGTGSDRARGVAVGDVNGDGDLDLVVGNGGQQNVVYLNAGDGTFSISHTFGTGADDTFSVALGDVDDDGDLDLAVGNDGQPNVVYLNDGDGTFDMMSYPFGTGSDATYGVALGDVDGDGDLDLVLGNYRQQNAVYLNGGDGTFPISRTFGSGSDWTRSVALGDVDGDGDLDLAVGNYGLNAVYLNGGDGTFSIGRTLGTRSDGTRGVALGDVDGDGDLDAVVGNYERQNILHLNDGDGTFDTTSYTFGTGADDTGSVALGDVDGDGDLDLVLGNYRQQNVVYLNDGVGQFDWAAASRTFGPGSDETESLALGDVNGDGSLDVVVGNDGQPNALYLNRARVPHRLANRPPTLRVGRPGRTADAGFYSTPDVLEHQLIPFTYTLSDAEGDPVRYVRAFYSPDGGGRWFAAALTNTVVTDLVAVPSGSTHVLTWDTFASGFFGRSDDVVFRIEAYPGFQPAPNAVAGPYQWPYVAATTFPFRVRGTQVRVYSSTVAAGNELADVLVYRIPAGQLRGAPLADGAGNPYHTDARGYLQGRGQLGVDDRLVALLPITATDSYTLYYTSAAPTLTGLDAHAVANPGVQTLVVSEVNPLVLFNLDISLQWDARRDTVFMDQLTYDLQRTSELLYDWSDGQAALGAVSIHHDRELWNDADVRIYASNRLRPNAVKGGIVTQETDEVISSTGVFTETYVPGQVRMGAVWSRYGDSGSNLGEDWPRALAHELGHYALYLDDNYLGMDENGLLIPVTGCPGVMSDSYRKDYPYDEFHPQLGWTAQCTQTLSHRTTGRSDWETIEARYPWLTAPDPITNTGPSVLPLAVTQIDVVEPLTPSTVSENPTFYLVDESGERVQPGSDARVMLFQDDRLTDLGRPTLDYVLARGARPGDRLCVYDLEAGRLGCETILDENDVQLELAQVVDWQPNVFVTPATSRTIPIQVTGVPTTAGWALRARLFPLDASAPEAISLVQTAEGYAGTFYLAETDRPALEGYVQVWATAPAQPLREIVTDYTLGGSPDGGGHPSGVATAPKLARFAPGMSSDGQVILFGDLYFDRGEIFALQSATTVPSPPPWATVVGQAYHLTGPANRLEGASISFQYLGREVPPGEEDWLRLYYRAPTSATWQLLPTQLDTYYNNAAAPAQGPGLYALMSSFEIPLYGPGWNLFSYPVQATRPVSHALLAISGVYTTVYGYEAADTADPWKVYDVAVPAWVNDLESLQFARGYWINVSDAITLYLKGSSEYDAALASGFPYPPATYYGRVLPGSGFDPEAGMAVTAWISDTLCGQGVVLDVTGYGLAYAVDVMAEDWGEYAGCGAPGRAVTFQVGSQEMISGVGWDNSRVWELALRPPWRLYMPLMARE